MNIGAISSSPATPATSGSATAHTQTAGGGNAAVPIAGNGASFQLAAKTQALISKLKQQDPSAQQHQPGHPAGSQAVSYTYGPSGAAYAGADAIQINTSPGRTPEQAIARAQAIEAAALAPAYPSGADRAIAVQAQQLEAQAEAELAAQQAPNPVQASAPAAAPAEQLNVVNPAGSVNKAYGAESATAPSLDTYA